MNIEQVREYALCLPSATEDFPFGPEVLAMRVGGRIFMAIDLESSEGKAAMKLDPDYSADLREHKSWIKPAFHWNKKYWNDVYVEHVDDSLMRSLIDYAYQQVFAKLPKKVREEIGE